MNQRLRDILDRIEAWPAEAQDELLEMVREIEAAQAGTEYAATAEELTAIDEAEKSGLATPEEVAAAFAKFRA
jgi:hypothetical protein